MSSLLIQNATIVTSFGKRVGDVLCENGEITQIATNIDPINVDELIYASGLYLLPGGIDAHTHMEIPMMGTESSDSFESGTYAAAKGGTTSIIDFANQSKGESLHETLDKWLAKASNCYGDYSFHLAVTDVNEKTLLELKDLKERGISSFKTFLAYKAMRLNDQEIRSLMREIKSLGAMMTTHCEMGEEVEKNIELLLSEKKLTPKYHPESRPEKVEAEATKHLLDLSIEENCPAYIVHMTCKGSVDALRAAKKKSKTVFGETCIQYLLLDCSKYDQEFGEASKFILSPPLREKNNQKALWEALRDGTIDVVATDHCPFTTDQRKAGKENFTKIPNGLGGVEERMILLFSEGVMKERISLERYVELSSTNPAKLFNLYPQKGEIAVGSDADLILIDPTISQTIHIEDLHTNVDYSAYEGMQVQGKITQTVIKGKTTLERSGQFLER